jgi:hypothetical protein
MLKFLHRGRREGRLTVAETYTLILTKGMHVISSSAALQIKDAILKRCPTVDVELDPFGGFHTSRVTTIVTRHVVALTANPPAEEPPGNVVAIGQRAASTKR